MRPEFTVEMYNKRVNQRLSAQVTVFYPGIKIERQ